MNKSTAKKLLKIQGKLIDLKEELESLTESAQDKLDNASEKYQDSDKGQEDAQNISYMEDCTNEINSAIESINAIDGLMD